ncbi:glycosyltransferase family 2 protein [Goodfellowiella coeruleoviolacea]|uniref:Glycosyl transferase family 2 n=1 Tax=Goodfellowiella coeruleoviolacea TaxID=334858 RepID=A0AAE3KIX6_9PSEU|nr:glycosyltransferase family 2 protein [Goodfellowiella coeruleoviolacea]MCP2163733.1 Glycosyl transferase family 2 [Goodfellowiella coeruleoviolacea]
MSRPDPADRHPHRDRTTEIDVLVPTRGRPVELATTLAGLAGQRGPAFRVVVSDQSDGQPSYATPAAETMARVLRHQGRPVEFLRHLPRRGLAEQRHFLLGRARAEHVLFLDDDVWLEPDALATMHRAIGELGCGLVGMAVQGLSYLDDVRPHELVPYEEWTGRPEPEVLSVDSPAWQRMTLHNAANPTHLAERLNLAPGEWRAYKIAWVGGCVLYDRQALVRAGGFGFWAELPEEHAGEDVLAQWRVMAKYGGAGILPSGAVHLEAPTTVVNRETEVTRVLPV